MSQRKIVAKWYSYNHRVGHCAIFDETSDCNLQCKEIRKIEDPKNFVDKNGAQERKENHILLTQTTKTSHTKIIHFFRDSVFTFLGSLGKNVSFRIFVISCISAIV